MRNFLQRPILQKKGLDQLESKAFEIIRSKSPKATAETIYKNSRKTKWFLDSVVSTLGELSGTGQRCMFCGGSESSQVDHFLPKAKFPYFAMCWENFIWICGVCNQHKGDKFPCDYDLGNLLINPLDEDIWKYFTLDRLGFMMPKWNIKLDDIDKRAKETEGAVKLNRQIVQETRQFRITHLISEVEDAILLHDMGHLNKVELRERLNNWMIFPLHPEVPQYFFEGPGNVEEPFSAFLVLVT